MITKFDKFNTVNESSSYNPFDGLKRLDYKNRLWSLEYLLRSEKKFNFNPIIQGYKLQRELVWTLDDKQDFIDSLYHLRYLGSFIVVDRLGDDNELLVIDGKQRLNCLLDFFNNKFPDSKGFYWKDIVKRTQSSILKYSNFTYMELPEDATAQDMRDAFLHVNHKGKKVDDSHIDYVKNMKLK